MRPARSSTGAAYVRCRNTAYSFSALLPGPTSRGSLYAAAGFPSIPSSTDPSPHGDPYLSGGYNTQRFGCPDGSNVCGLQIEANFTGVRDDAISRARFAEATARVLETYLAMHWGIRLTSPAIMSRQRSQP